jgi:hypothetical protein
LDLADDERFGEGGRRQRARRRRARKGADVAFTPNDDGTLRLRCLHEQCRIRVTTADGKTSETTLANDESANLPLDADYELTF